MASRTTPGTDRIQTPCTASPKPLTATQARQGSIHTSTAVRFLQMRLDSTTTLASLYMPMIIHGGIFVASESDLPALNERVFLMLGLEELDKERSKNRSRELVTLTRVIWLYSNPCDSPGPNRRGYGLQFESDGDATRSYLEGLIADSQTGSQADSHKEAPEYSAGEGSTCRKGQGHSLTF